MRLIKKYNNRKLYDTTLHRYVTLGEVERLVKDGQPLIVKTAGHKSTKTDVTATVLTQILVERELSRLVCRPVADLISAIQNPI